MTDDGELLRSYAAERSEAAFAELVRRHVDLVYSAALRQMDGDHHRAEEVTQMVFTDLARKAAALARHPVLPAWLHRGTGLAAAMVRRREGRRSKHERDAAAEALRMGGADAGGGVGRAGRSLAEPLASDALSGSDGSLSGAVEWERVRPILDGALNELGERDREAIVLRYFGDLPFAEVGRRLGLSENAARMRVGRALDKLRGRLARASVTSTSAALAAALTQQAVMAAPAGVAASSTAAALAATAVAVGAAGASAAGAAGAGAGGAWSAMAGSAAAKAALVSTGLGGGFAATSLYSFMSANIVSVSVLSAVVAGSAASVFTQQKANARIEADLASLTSAAADLPALNREVSGLRRSAAETRALLDEAGDEARLVSQRKDLAAEAARLQKAVNEARIAAARAAPVAPGGAVKVFDISTLDQQPVPLAQARPQYPFEMRRAGISGQAVVDFIVDTSGKVMNAYAISSSQKEFEDAAVQAVSGWTFSSGLKAGQSVNTHMQVPVVFTVNDDSAVVAPGRPTPVGGSPGPAARAAAPAPSDWFPANAR